MPLVLPNTWSNQAEPFLPLDPEGREVLIYSCGPTVYSYAHIGNFRSFLLGDLLRRTLERRGYTVRHVMNITDVGHMTEDHLADAEGEDKLAVAARRIGKDPFEVARFFEAAFVEDARALRLKNQLGAEGADRSLHPQATRYIGEMLDVIERLIERGLAYTDGQGQVYFEISRFPAYGQLSGKVLDELEAGARVDVREGKRDPRDFALWKTDQKHLMQWDPHAPEGWPAEDWARFRALRPQGVNPGIGRGFPGWHIECSAMSRSCLAEAIDIHTGGEDNIFPHHECEIAQSVGAFDTHVPGPDGGVRANFARYWVHGRHLMVDNRKMSKRDGTFFTLKDLLDPVAAGRPELSPRLRDEAGFADGKVSASVLRAALVWTPFQQSLNFSMDLLYQARVFVGRYQGLFDRLREQEPLPGEASPALLQALERGRLAFDAALDDCVDTAAAISALTEAVSAINAADPRGAGATAALAFLTETDAVLDLLDRRRRSGIVTTAELGEGSPRTDAELDALADDDPALAERYIGARQAAKRARDFARADGLRAALKARGVLLDDTKDGVRWKLA
jgi:cysteinyl-tRNA synthetase